MNPNSRHRSFKPSILTFTQRFFYSGLARRKSALSLLWLSVMSVGVVSFQWFFWGYSLAFSHTAGKYIGDLNNFGLKGVLAAPSVGSDKVPDILFAVFQGMFACITLVLGYKIEEWTTLIMFQCCHCSWCRC